MHVSRELLLSSLLFCVSCGSSKEQYVERGNELFEKHKLAEANLQYRNALKQDSNYAEAYYRLGLLFHRETKVTEAITFLEKSVSLQPSHTEARAALAKLYLEGLIYLPSPPPLFYERLTRIAADYLKADEKSFEGHRLLGHLAMLDSKPDQAVVHFRTALSLEPQSPEVPTLLTQALLSNGQTAEAEAFAQKAIATNPKQGPIYDILYTHYRAGKRLRDGEELLQRRITANPTDSLAVLQLARHYQSLKEIKKADDILAKLAGSDHADGIISAADFLRDSGDMQRATELYQRGMATDAVHANSYRKRLVNLYLRTGQSQQAEILLESILKDDQNDTEAIAAKAFLRAASGRPADLDVAIAAFTKLVAANPNNVSYLYDLARLLRLRGREEDSRTELLRAIKSNPHHLPSLEDLAAIGIQRANARDAMFYAGRALTINPKLARTRLIYTAALALQGKSVEARQEVNDLLREFPNLREAHLQLALLNIQDKRFKEAEAIYKRHYIPKQKDPRILRGLVELGFASGQPEKALQALQEEVRLQPASVEVRRLLAITAGRMNKPEIAIEHFQWIKQNMPASASVELALGLAQQQKGDLAVAIAQFENARRMEPNNPEILATLAYALQQMGKSAEAVPIYRQALQARPTSLVLMNNLAVALSESGGDLKEALQLAQSTTSKDSANPIYADALGLVYLKRKETGNAVQAFRSAVANDSTNVSYRIHLARALTENGNKASAKAELDGAVLRSPSPEERKEITELSQR